MKNVILDIPTQTVMASNVSAAKCYGVKPFPGQEDKGFLMDIGCNTGIYSVRTFDFTQGDIYDVKFRRLNALVAHLLKNNWQVYEFDSPQELFKWLSE